MALCRKYSDLLGPRFFINVNVSAKQNFVDKNGKQEGLGSGFQLFVGATVEHPRQLSATLR